MLMMLCLPSQVSFDNPGMWYALAAGALASAGGYVIWYMVVVRFTVTVAAVVQLSVPVITAIGGVLFVVGILAAMWYSHKLKLRNEAPFAITERL